MVLETKNTDQWDPPGISQIHEEIMKQKAGPQDNRGSRGTESIHQPTLASSSPLWTLGK